MVINNNLEQKKIPKICPKSCPGPRDFGYFWIFGVQKGGFWAENGQFFKKLIKRRERLLSDGSNEPLLKRIQTKKLRFIQKLMNQGGLKVILKWS